MMTDEDGDRVLCRVEEHAIRVLVEHALLARKANDPRLDHELDKALQLLDRVTADFRGLPA